LVKKPDMVCQEARTKKKGDQICHSKRDRSITRQSSAGVGRSGI
jgi:hypothetical protein